MFSPLFATSNAPEDCRIVNIVPLLKKKSSRDKIGSYRPMCLASMVGKLFKKILKYKIYVHLERQGQFMDIQHDIMHGKSSLSNLITFF